MFPLGTALFPHVVMPLRVFEPRYRTMLEHCFADDRTFGVVLIERGHEVGGGDVRFPLGTMAAIVGHAEFPDGQHAIEVAGTHRILVVEWLPDDPYPRAHTERIDDVAASEAAGDLRDVVGGVLRRVLALRAELGEPAAPATVELNDDPSFASWEAALLADLGPLDAQHVLEQPGPDARLAWLLDHLAAEAQDLEARLN